MKNEFKKAINLIFQPQIIKEELGFKEKLELNKKRLRDLKIDELLYYMENAKKYLEKADQLYKELINKTEYWENKSTIEFNTKNWNQLRKTKGFFIRYYNDLIVIKENLKEQKRRKNGKND